MRVVVTVSAGAICFITDRVTFITGILDNGNLNLLISCKGAVLLDNVVKNALCIIGAIDGISQRVNSFCGIAIPHRVNHTAGSIQHQHHIQCAGGRAAARQAGRHGRQGNQKIRTLRFGNGFVLVGQRAVYKIDCIGRYGFVSPDTADRRSIKALGLIPDARGVRVADGSFLCGLCRRVVRCRTHRQGRHEQRKHQRQHQKNCLQFGRFALHNFRSILSHFVLLVILYS